MTDDVTRILREAYDRRVEGRAMRPAPAWESAERDTFLEVLRQERATTLLELGAMNCLVHVPKSQLRGVLGGISRVIKPGGLFYLGLYGGREFEGVWDQDYFEPKRFFCHHLDENLCALVGEFFSLESFRRIPHGWNGLHFQSMILRRPSTAAQRG
jgi:hypothetical protein